jgi:16S rRNA C967 or C1407 C5-methylase (RsmB/RsmF family)
MQLSDDFIAQTRLLFGDQRFERFVNALGEEPPVSIRLNPRKKACSSTLTASDAVAQVPWCPSGIYLKSRPNFTFDPLFHAGCYYVQEASSMFVDLVLRQYVNEPVAMLDMCAAPGGKSTAARSVLPEGSVLVSNEPIRLRAQVLTENIQKWGYPDCIVTNNYPKDFRKVKALFDVILCDVPCSGEGMFRKDEGAVGEWSTQNVEKCWQLQRSIVSEAWQCLAEGGLFIYSTCTYNTKEDEENVRWMTDELGAEVLPVDIMTPWNITSSLLEGFNQPVYRFIPGYTRGEGLFMAVLRKPGTPRSSDPRNLQSVSTNICKALNVLYDGQPKAEKKGHDLIPVHAEALSVLLDRDKYPMAELDYPTAIAYLRGEAISLPSDMPRGYIIVTFHRHPLGFVKNIGNRANNLYPKEWRIKSTHIPDYPDILKTTLE